MRLRQMILHVRMTFADAAQAYLQQGESNLELKPRTRQYRTASLGAICKTWPGIPHHGTEEIEQATGRENDGKKYDEDRKLAGKFPALGRQSSRVQPLGQRMDAGG